MSKRFFISDVHMGPMRTPANSRFQYDWLNDTEKNALVSFLKYIDDKEDNSTELVLVGDVLDNWICPHDERPPTFSEIFAAHPEIVDAIKALLNKGVSVTFVEGNHDMHLSQEDLNVAFGSHDNLKYAETYHQDGVYAAHGHSFDPFNKLATGSTDLYNLPLGYFISRIVATTLATTDSFREPTIEVIQNSLKAIADRDNVAVSVFNTILEEAGLNEGITFLMPDGEEISVSAVRVAYANTKSSLSIKDLQPKAEYLSRDKDNIKVVIFGHTHAELSVGLDPQDEDDPFMYKRIYVNSGTWSESIAPTYVEVESKGKYESHVRLMAWKGGIPYKIDNKFFRT